MTNVTDEVLGKIARQQNDLFRRVREGSLDPNVASAGLQLVIENKLSTTPASPTDIVDRVMRQLARYEALGIGIADADKLLIIEQAKNFVPLSATDRPLVTGLFGYESDAINSAWKHVALEGYDSMRYFDESQPLRFARGMKPTNTNVRLVHFDPNSYHRLSPKDALIKAKKDRVRLAGIEIIEMLIVEPEWALEWNGKEHPYPNLSALQTGTAWQRCPYINRWDVYRLLKLHASSADYAFDYWASPSVREC